MCACRRQDKYPQAPFPLQRKTNQGEATSPLYQSRCSSRLWIIEAAVKQGKERRENKD